MDTKKVLGIVGLCISAIATTLVTVWMTDKEIDTKIEEKYAEIGMNVKES